MLARAYLTYLRLVSRRIIHQAGFERILRRKTDLGLNLADHPALDSLLQGSTWPVRDLSTQRFLAHCRPRLDDGRMGLFLGLGLVQGTYKGRELTAPLAFVPVDVELDDAGPPQLRLHHNEAQLNHDLLAVLIQTTVTRDTEADDLGLLEPEVQYRLDQLDRLEDDLVAGSLPHTDVRSLIVSLAWRLRSLLDYLGGAIPAQHFRPEEKPPAGDWLQYDEPILFLHRVPGDLTTHQALEDILAADDALAQPSLLEALTNLVLRDEPLPALPADEVPDATQLAQAVERLPVSLSAAQRQLLQEVWHHRVLYLEGPPGTGKSHTIAALMALAGSLGRSVLLTSQKPAALQVVQEKLAPLLGADAAVILDPAARRQTKQQIQDRQESARRRDAARRLAEASEQLAAAQDELAALEHQADALHTDLVRLTELAHQHASAQLALVAAREEFGQALHRLQLALAPDWQPNAAVATAPVLQVWQRLVALDRQPRQPRTALIWQRKYLKALRQALVPPPGVSFRPGQRQLIPLLVATSQQAARATEAARHLAPIPALQPLPTTRREAMALQEPLRRQHLLTLQRAWQRNQQRQAQAHNAVLEAYHKSLNYVGKTERIRELWSRFTLPELVAATSLWMGELRHLNRLLPLAPEAFDFVIVDEASQVNIAEVAPAFHRAKRILVVGDERQLHLDATGVNFSLSATFDGLCWQRSGMGRYLPFGDAVAQQLTVGKASILRWLNPSRTGIARVRLEEHFRSLPQLARYTSQQFYDGTLRIMTDHPSRALPPPPVRLHLTGGKRKGGKVIAEEVRQALTVVQEHVDRYLHHPQDPFFQQVGLPTGKPPSIGLLAFNRDQADALDDALDRWDPSLRQRHHLMAGTVEDWQGNERDILILTLGWDGETRYAGAFYDNPNRFNVATSRARHYLEVVLATLPPPSSRPYRLLAQHGLVADQPTAVRPAWAYREADLPTEWHRLVARWLWTAYLPLRPGLELATQVMALDHEPLPFVLYRPETGALAALELDGLPADTVASQATQQALDRDAVLARAGWPVVHVSSWNWYQGIWPAPDDHLPRIAELARITRELDAALQITR